MSSVNNKRKQNGEEDVPEPKLQRVGLRQLEPNESLLFALSFDLLEHIIHDYVQFYHFSLLRLVCRKMSELLSPSGGRFYVPTMTKSGYFSVARWAYEKGAPFDIYWEESFIKAAEIEDIEALRWLIEVKQSRGWGLRIPTAAFEHAVYKGRDDILELLRTKAVKGHKRFEKVMYLRAILNDDLNAVKRLAPNHTRPCRAFMIEASSRNRPDFVEPLLRDGMLKYIICLRSWSAAKTGSIEFIEWLDSNGIELNHWYYSEAIKAKQYGVLEWLITNFGIKDSRFKSTVGCAFWDIPMLDFLVDQGVEVDPKEVFLFILTNMSQELFTWAHKRGILPSKGKWWSPSDHNVEWLRRQATRVGIDHSEWVFDPLL